MLILLTFRVKAVFLVFLVENKRILDLYKTKPLFVPQWVNFNVAPLQMEIIKQDKYVPLKKNVLNFTEKGNNNELPQYFESD